MNNLLGGQNQTNTISPWPVTRFHYELPNADVVSLKIYTSTGELIRTLLDQVQQQPGDPDAFWDGRKDDGSYAPSGTYFYVIETQNSGAVVNKMILLSN
jgi:flagellar hook assembly protein FlgD